MMTTAEFVISKAAAPNRTPAETALIENQVDHMVRAIDDVVAELMALAAQEGKSHSVYAGRFMMVIGKRMMGRTFFLTESSDRPAAVNDAIREIIIDRGISDVEKTVSFLIASAQKAKMPETVLKAFERALMDAVKIDFDDQAMLQP